MQLRRAVFPAPSLLRAAGVHSERAWLVKVVGADEDEAGMQLLYQTSAGTSLVPLVANIS